MTDAALARGYAECTRLTRAYGDHVLLRALLLPRPRRRHVHAVYALCRLADDIVDAPGATHGGHRRHPGGPGRLPVPVRGGAGRRGAAGRRRARRRGPHGDRLRHRPECFDRFFDATWRWTWT
ncbi:MAG: squalene/phytoene synthase family protein [Micropruina sp.]